MYRISVSTNDQPIADAHGDLETIAYHVRKLNLQPDTEYSAELLELAAIHGDELRTVASITGDAEIVNYVLTKRLRQERKAQEPAPEPEESVTK